MSRAETARCPRHQTATGGDQAGARLSLTLTEMERLYDDCPQRFDPGVPPGRRMKTVFKLYDGGATPRTGRGVVTWMVALTAALYTYTMTNV